MTFRWACSSVTWGRNPDVLAMLRDIRDAGFEGVEFQQPMDWLGDPALLGRRARALGLEVAGFYHGSGLLEIINEAEMGTHRAAIDYAAALETRIYMVAGGWLKGREATEQDYAILATHLDELAEYASRYQLTVSYHPHMGSIVETLAQAERLFQRVAKATLCPDVAHLAVAGSDPIEVIRRFGERITHVHLKDYRAGSRTAYDPRGFCELGQGDMGLNFSLMLEALAQIGYDGWVVVELDRTESTPLESARMSREYLRRLGFA